MDQWMAFVNARTQTKFTFAIPNSLFERTRLQVAKNAMS